MMRIFKTLGLILLAFVLTASSNGIQAAPRGPITIAVQGDSIRLILANESNPPCAWGPDSRPTLNLAGMCGRDPATKNVYMIYAHNGECDAAWCHWMRRADGGIGGPWNWPALAIGEQIVLHVDGRDLTGRVIQVIPFADLAGVDGNTEFSCPGRVCGTLTTSAGRVHVDWTTVRIVYQ